ncbi:hypothetical protein Y032_0187g1119 [Ancylostoma ceylanicum]|uniref:Uncharacterized protein n=1 Tax=Ancylostoma ceylanicum TaxID=53326 RepID=A0A016SR41_9BILA|nr:hypothetical protein Y032_0187g1119 [Ancylostoma ceylanicum]
MVVDKAETATRLHSVSLPAGLLPRVQQTTRGHAQRSRPLPYLRPFGIHCLLKSDAVSVLTREVQEARLAVRNKTYLA